MTEGVSPVPIQQLCSRRAYACARICRLDICLGEVYVIGNKIVSNLVAKFGSRDKGEASGEESPTLAEAEYARTRSRPHDSCELLD